MVMRIYGSWSEEEVEKFTSYDWGIDWEEDNWAYFFLCGDFKEGWTCDDLMNALQNDIKENNLGEDEIKEKYQN